MYQPIRTCLQVLTAGLSLFLTTFSVQAAEPWQEPSHWADVGSVNSWMDIDLRLNNGTAGAVLTVSSHQQDYYDRTLVHMSNMPAIGLDAFLGLSELEQQERRDEAYKALSLVIRWHYRLVYKANCIDYRNWGGGQTGVTMMELVLTELQTSSGVDPTNPYVWHLLGWFRAVVGDLDRSEQCFLMAEQVLTHVPDDQMINMRRRLALDRAWNKRTLGQTELARVQVAKAAQYGGVDFETHLLNGLLAAADGNQNEAIIYAMRVEDIGDYGLKHGRRLPKPLHKKISDYTPRVAAAWILASFWLKKGYPEEAAEAFTLWRFQRNRNDMTIPFAHRFWQDAGTVYYCIGRQDRAMIAWRRGLHFTPFRPYFVYRAYSADKEDMPGLTYSMPFYLNYNSMFGGGSRFAFALTMARTLKLSDSMDEYMNILACAQKELLICMQTGEFQPQVCLALESIYRRTGQDPMADNCRQRAVEAFEHLGYTVEETEPPQMLVLKERIPKRLSRTVVKSPANGTKVPWPEDRPVQEVLDEKQMAYFANPTPENRRELARFLIRNLKVNEGRNLLLRGHGSLPGTGEDFTALGDEDLIVLLEADRFDNVATTSRRLVELLLSGNATQWQNGEVWALAGLILLDEDERAGGLVAMEHALELDPDNGGLRMHMKLFGK